VPSDSTWTGAVIGLSIVAIMLAACGAVAVIHVRTKGVTPASPTWQYLRARRIRREMRVLRRIRTGPASLVDHEFAQIIANFEEAS
jgi:hypothetical protein